CRSLLFRAFVCRSLLFRAFVCRSLLFRAFVCRSLLFRAFVCRSLLFRAFVCRSLLFRAFVCRTLVSLCGCFMFPQPVMSVFSPCSLSSCLNLCACTRQCYVHSALSRYGYLCHLCSPCVPTFLVNPLCISVCVFLCSASRSPSCRVWFSPCLPVYVTLAFPSLV
uniref:Uncharacterized protein n=1 Tax=Maylandia zebra TaxID=106582 RepID=A0A3P9D1Y8_9CICH